MDKLAKRLRDDAGKIDARVSPELDARLRASLAGIRPEPRTRRTETARPPWFWWASSLTGIAAAAAVVAVVNLRGPAEPGQQPTALASTLDVPVIDWQVRPAVLTSPLEQEYADLRADLEKAEQALKDDIDGLLR